MDEMRQENINNTKECPRCHGFVPASASFCNCGYNFTSEKLFCNQCGCELAPKQKFCPRCKKEQDKIICPSCKRIIPSSVKFCQSCGVEITYIKENDEIKTQDINLEENCDNFEVNIGRKRVFLTIELLLIALVALILLFVPIFINDNFFITFSSYFKQDAEFPFIRGLDVISAIINHLKDSDVSIFATLSNKLMYDNKLFFNFNELTSGIIISGFYILSFISLIANVIGIFIGMFSKKVVYSIPITINAIIHAIFMIFILIISINNGAYKAGLDSGITYAFLISFISCIFSLFIFSKETRLYKKAISV